MVREEISLGGTGRRLLLFGGLAAVAGLGGALALGVARDDHLRGFLHSYLVAFMYFLTLALGMLFFVALQHLVRAGWSVTVRRLAELSAGTLPVFALLALPILVPVLRGNTSLYAWTDHNLVATDHLLHHKEPYLNLTFFALRVLLYFAVWTLLAWFFLRGSTAQDESGDPRLTRRMEKVAAPGIILFALTLTFASIDFVMSLDAHWFSTMIGVYFFAGSVVSSLAFLIVLTMALQRGGRLTSLVNREHFHDLGKLLFAFVFFWGYIAFSQFMLIWYADLPEETAYIRRRIEGAWLGVSVLLLAGHLFLPFLGLLSRQVKRHRGALAFWAAWLLLMHWVDMFWFIGPEHSPENLERLPLSLIDVLAFVGVGGAFIATIAALGVTRSLVPLKDPRMSEALSFENV